MNLFGNNSDDGCTAHHWGEYNEKWQDSMAVNRTRTRAVNSADAVSILKIEVPKVRHCLHEGCNATDKKTYPNTYVVPMSVLSEHNDHVALVHGLMQFLSGPNGEEIEHALRGRAGDLHGHTDNDAKRVAKQLRRIADQIDAVMIE